MARQWMRLYVEVLHDAKVQRLPAPLFRTWINILLCAAEHDGVLPPLDELSFELRQDEPDTLLAMDSLRIAKLLDYDEETETYSPHNWAGRQYQSNASERADSGALGNHRRWHLDTGKPSLTCRYCIAEGFAISDEPVATAIAEQVAISGAPPSDPPILVPSTRKNRHITPAVLARLQREFPDLDVNDNWVRGENWLKERGLKRTDYVAFLRNWLRKEQNKDEPIVYTPRRGARVAPSEIRDRAIARFDAR